MLELRPQQINLRVMSNSDAPKKITKPKKLTKDERLAEQLRANLRRRKAAAKRQKAKNEGSED